MAEQFQIYLDKIRQGVKKTSVGKYAMMLEEKSKVNFEYFIAGFGVLLVFCVFFGIFAGFITNMIGFIYPGYMTLLALDGDHEGIQTNWLIYWSMYSVLTLIEDYGEFIIYWIPFYYPAKAAFLIYMMLPQTNGAKKIYEIARPYLAQVQDSKTAGKAE